MDRTNIGSPERSRSRWGDNAAAEANLPSPQPRHIRNNAHRRPTHAADSRLWFRTPRDPFSTAGVPHYNHPCSGGMPGGGA